ncbi:MAG: DoxX family protein [Betaproteobacteria bacterium]|nr:MAG: DoxX family protein [Betaproteobacteria bacterium]
MRTWRFSRTAARYCMLARTRESVVRSDRGAMRYDIAIPGAPAPRHDEISPALVYGCRNPIPRSPPMSSLAAPAGRILIALIFLLSGIDKIVHYAPTLGYMQKAGLPFPELLLIASAIIEIVAALAIMAGWKTRWAAALLFLWMIPVTWVFHNPGGGQEQMAHFMKNVAISGGLLLLFALGPGAFSVSRSS